MYLYCKRKIAFVILSWLLSIGSTIFVFVFTFNLQLRIFTDMEAFAPFQDFMLDLYIKPYGRCVPYIIGLATGVFYMEYRSTSITT